MPVDPRRRARVVPRIPRTLLRVPALFPLPCPTRAPDADVLGLWHEVLVLPGPSRAELGWMSSLVSSRQAGFLLEPLAESGIPVESAVVRLASRLVPGLEPATRGPAVDPSRVTSTAEPVDTEASRIVQGRLGDCWLVAALVACENSRPGFLASLVRRRSSGFVEVRLPGIPRQVVMTPFLPPRARTAPLPHRLAHAPGRAADPTDDASVEEGPATLVEKACAVLFRRSYPRLAGHLPGTGLRLLTGGARLRRVPRDPTGIARLIATGVPVLAATRPRPGGSFLVAREDDPTRSIAVMDDHVYAVLGVRRCTEDGLPDPEAPPRLHLRNPVGTRETEPRSADVFLSPAQARRALTALVVGRPLLLDDGR